MQDTLQAYIPNKAIPQVLELLKHDNLVVKVKQERKTRHGDYKSLPNGRHQITVNSNLRKNIGTTEANVAKTAAVEGATTGAIEGITNAYTAALTGGSQAISCVLLREMSGTCRGLARPLPVCPALPAAPELWDRARPVG